jgi:hypothetical protein
MLIYMTSSLETDKLRVVVERDRAVYKGDIIGELEWKEDGSCSDLSPCFPLGEEMKRKRSACTGFETVGQCDASPRKGDWEGVEQVSSHHVEQARHINSHQPLRCMSSSSCIATLLQLSKSHALVLESGAGAAAPLGAIARLRTSLTLLDTDGKVNVGSAQLVIPTLGSQENKMNSSSSSKQGQTIMQLLNAHMVRMGIIS